MNIKIEFRPSVQSLSVWKMFVLALVPSGIGGALAYHYDLESWRPLIQGLSGLLLLSFLIKSIRFTRQPTYTHRPLAGGIFWMFLLGILGWFFIILLWAVFKVSIWELAPDSFDDLYPYYAYYSACGCEYPQKAMQFYVFSVLLTPIEEEVFHRRMILSRLLDNHGALYSIIVSTLLFSILHPGSPITAFLFGVFAGWVFLKTRNLLYIIAIHAGYNFINYILYENATYLLIKDVEHFSSLSNWTLEMVFGLSSLLAGLWILWRMGLFSQGFSDQSLAKDCN